MSISEAEFRFLEALLRENSAMVLEPTKGYLVESRLGPVARKHDLGTISALLGKLRTTSDRVLKQEIVEAMTINETSFLRDSHPFDAMCRHIVPEVLSKRTPNATLNIWCAACSTGQEPYSIAMTLRDRCPQLADRAVSIRATDLSEEVLRKARAGSYSQLEVNRGLPAGFLTRFFTQEGSRWQLRQEIRRMVDFQQMNLAASWPLMPKMDVIFLRNVLIYFPVAVKKRVLEMAARQLNTDGVLFLGSSETTIGVSDEYERATVGQTVCYRQKACDRARS